MPGTAPGRCAASRSSCHLPTRASSSSLRSMFSNRSRQRTPAPKNWRACSLRKAWLCCSASIRQVCGALGCRAGCAMACNSRPREDGARDSNGRNSTSCRSAMSDPGVHGLPRNPADRVRCARCPSSDDWRQLAVDRAQAPQHADAVTPDAGARRSEAQSDAGLRRARAR